jgi:hypothetical protein
VVVEKLKLCWQIKKIFHVFVFEINRREKSLIESMLFTVWLLIVLFCLCSSCISFCLVVQEIVVVVGAGVVMQLNLSLGKKKGLGARLKGTRFEDKMQQERERGTHAPKSIQSSKVRKSALLACPHKSTMLFLIFVFMFHWLS